MSDDLTMHPLHTSPADLPALLPPLPEPFMELMSAFVRNAWAEQMRAYALAARAERDAEIARLKAKLQEAVKGQFTALLSDEFTQQLAERDERIRELEGHLSGQMDNTVREFKRAEAAEAEIERLKSESRMEWKMAGDDFGKLFSNLTNRAEAAEARISKLLNERKENERLLHELIRERDALRADRDQCVKNMNDNAEHADTLRARLEAIQKQPTVAYRFNHGGVVTEITGVAAQYAKELIERPELPE